MNLRPAISAPLPWLTFLAGRLFGRKRRPERIWLFSRSIRFTRQGKLFTAVLLAIGFAAINTGNNLLYLVLAMLLSLIIISGVLSEVTLKGLDVALHFPPRIYRSRPVRIRVEAENRKRFFSSFSFAVSSRDGAGSFGSAWFAKLRARRKAAASISCTFERRGRHAAGASVVETTFPFGLFVKGRRLGTGREIIVYPRIVEVKGAALINATEGGSSGGSRKKGAGSELYNLREYTPRDDSRFIHWRSAARSDELLVKEFEREKQREITIILENRSPAGDPSPLDMAADEAAGLAAHFLGRNFSVALKTLDDEVPAGRGRNHLYRILKALALMGPAKEGEPSLRVVCR